MTERMSTFFRLSLRALHSGLSVPYISCPMKRYSGLEGCGADSVCSAHPCADEHRPFRAACPDLADHHRMLSGIRSYLSASGHPGRLQLDPASLVQRCDAVGIRRCPGVCNQYLSGQPRCDALSGYPCFTDNHAFVYVIIFIPLGISIYHCSHRKIVPSKPGTWKSFLLL